ncbi:hypothetical protein BCR41DRAFT_217928 [Lobosporangium transversale]|uniref:SH3 domain-containing protein n=1 Tax=Lobosporangium transversale TaxID=64571 RepID=A0A1Y2G6U1_9FUNG|nr:hypothetical protein BCR41DRAFT_217928 [Lobosporangium transversale]ORY99527.1 hypothetical protein BCR41DRAFT_217928 [Lobosporangium transversale]|eukprot:XP_021875853.1 hypothetical protein BCR41DRAFT_217928 [Lobosporangium transversale]
MEHGLPVVCTVRVIYAFTAKEEGDLTINKGDIIKVHDNDGGWWKGTLLPDGIYGNFPSNFVEVISTNDDDSERSSPRSQPQSYRRQHSRQSSVDSSKFTKRKPVNTMLSNTNGTNKTGLTSSSASHLPYSGSTNASSISLGATSRKNPQAIIGDSGLCTTLPGAFPIASDTEKEPYLDSPGIQSDADYHLEYTSNQRRNSTSSALMDPSSPVHTTTYAAAESAVRQVSNRYSMPNLTDDTRTQQRHHPQHRSRDFTRPASAMYLQESDMGNKNSSSIWRGNSSGVSLAAYSDYGDFQNQELQDDQDYSEEQHHVESEILPTQQYDSFAGAPVQGHTNESLRYRPSYRHSGVSTGSAPFDYAPQQHQQQQQSIYSTNLSELSLENLAKHNRSQGALDKPKSQGTYGGGHRRNLSQVSLKPEGSAAFNPYDHQAQMYQAEHQSTFPVSARRSSLPRAPSIVIPQPKARPHSAYALSAPFQFSPTESSPSSYSAAQMHQLSRSPSSSATADSKGTAETLSSGGTAMSGASAIGTRDVRRKSETARMPQSNLMTASNFATRRFSVDAKDPLTSASVVGVSGTGESAAGDKAMDDASMSENLESLGAYTAKKPKASLMRAFKQILNPKKVAEKDAIRNKNEHFAWIEMQKSLKRVHSPEPGKEDTQFFADEDSAQENQDPFEIVKRCQPMRDSPPVPGGITSNNALELGPISIIQTTCLIYLG